MAKPKDDGIVQAVHYDDDGQVMWVRAFLRRGQVWSDYILVNRSELIEMLRAGKRIVVGERIHNLGATFITRSPVELIKKNGDEFIVSGEIQVDKDCLEGVPIL